jgi:hypothetical protein
MIQQQKLHHLHKLLLVLHRMPSRFRTKVVMVKLKSLPSQHQCNLFSRIRCIQCRISKNILPWEINMGSLQDGIYLVITSRLTSQICLSPCLRKFQKWNAHILTKLHLKVLQGLCTWMRKEWCSFTSMMGARTLKESGWVSSCSHGHTDGENTSYST